MGHSQNSRQSENKPKKGALDTVEDKTIDEKDATQENEEPKQDIEEQPAEEVTEEEPATEEEIARTEVEKAEEEVEALAPEEKEKVEEERKREKAPEEEIVEERIYTIPLRRAWIAPRKRRAPRAVRIVRSFIQRHMKIETEVKGEEDEEEERLVISNEVNEKLWSRGIEKPPRNIRVRAVKDKEGVVTLYLAEGD